MSESASKSPDEWDGGVTLLAVLSDSREVRECISDAICADRRFRVVASVPVADSVEALRNVSFNILIAHTKSSGDYESISAIATEFSTKLIIVVIGDDVHEATGLQTHSGPDVLETLKQIGRIERIRDVVAEAAARHGIPQHEPSETERIDRERLAVLTDRELEIMALTAQGMSIKGIAAQLRRATSTIETHRENIMRKVGLSDRVALTRLAIRTGLITA